MTKIPTMIPGPPSPDVVNPDVVDVTKDPTGEHSVVRLNFPNGSSQRLHEEFLNDPMKLSEWIFRLVEAHVLAAIKADRANRDDADDWQVNFLKGKP
jgi:hypothetical protein